MSSPAAGDATSEPSTEATAGTGMSRRRAITLAGVGVAGVAGVAAGATALVRGGDHVTANDVAAGAVPFHGEHQAGITTPAQDRLHFVAFDVITTDRAKLVTLLQDWTAAAARMTAGKDAGLIGAATPSRRASTSPATPPSSSA
ncbi:Dyp-type peroxidase domain-containing protein, partial [Micromonospora sp. NPDC003776]